MTIAFWCVLLAGLLPYISVAFAKLDKTFDNRDPRAWEEKLIGRQKRAYNAHLNAFEAFPLFASGVVIAHLSHAPQQTVDALAIGFIAVRIAYLWLYLEDKASLRSVIWTLGFGATIALFVISAMSAR